MRSRVGIEIRGQAVPITADLLDWVASTLIAVRDEYPDADLLLIHSAHGVTIEARGTRPVLLESVSSGVVPPAPLQKE